MTEVPDYLLERSRQRRQALGLSTGESEGGGGGGESSGAAAPATAAAAGPSLAEVKKAAQAAAAAATPEVPADPPWVEAAKTRPKIPMWVLPILFLLPLWGFVYISLLEQPPVHELGALDVGAEIYTTSGCAGCHGAGGEGGVGYAFTDGELLATFPELDEATTTWIAEGTPGSEPGSIIGDPNRPGGAHVVGAKGVMPGFGGSLTPADIYAVARYEREVLAGEEITPDEAAARDAEWENLKTAEG